MKTITQFVKDGITSLSDLADAIQVAMQLEFATIPPYLCAQWSINSDPSDVSDLIQDIVVQEMYHFALAGNMLTAIGGTPNIANADFITHYPTKFLPGGIPQALPVDLKPLSQDQLQVFMQIEFPEFPPVGLTARASGPTTIGAFYDTVYAGFATINPSIDTAARFVNMGEAVQIKSVADALEAISRIKGEGEGTQGDPNQPPEDGKQLAHYYVFKEILTGKTLVNAGGWSFSGPSIQFPTVYDFQQSTLNPSPSVAFNQAVSQLLIDLQKCWTSGGRPSTSAMFQLQTLGQGLIQQGFRPEFLWAPPAGHR